MAGKQVIMSRVYRYFKDRPDTVITLPEVEKDLDLLPGSASPALSRMSTSVTYRIAKGPHRGSYIYHSGPRSTVKTVDTVSAYPPEIMGKLDQNTGYAKGKSASQMYEYVGRMNDVAILLRGENDMMYVAMTLDSYVTGKP